MTYKFRGLDATGQKGWVYGHLTTGQKVLKEEPYVENRLMIAGYEVVPESVGIFTGFTDKNGKEVYEGDIVQVCYTSNGKFRVSSAYVTWVVTDRVSGFMLYTGLKHLSFNPSCKVIGNMYQNKELLKD